MNNANNVVTTLRAALFVSLVLFLAASPLAAQGNKKSCAVGVFTSFRDLGTDNVRSTARSYDSGVIGCDGRFLILFDHDVVYDLSQAGLGVVTTGGNLGVEVDLNTGLFGMGDGDSDPALKIQFNFVDAASNTRYFLSYGQRYNAPDCGLPGNAPCEVSNGTITFTAAVPGVSKRRWDIVAEDINDGNTRARLRACPAHGRCAAPVDRILQMPFGIALVEQ